MRVGHWIDKALKVVKGQVGFGQHYTTMVPGVHTGGRLQLEEGDLVQVKGDHFSVMFDKKTGGMSRFNIGAYNLLDMPMLPYLWWLPIYYKEGDDDKRYFPQWCTTAPDFTITPVDISACPIGENSVVVTVKNNIGTRNGMVQQVSGYSIYSNGLIIVDNRFIIPDDMPSFTGMGMSLALSKELNEVEWCRNESNGTCKTRKDTALTEGNNCAGENRYLPYTMAPENGNKKDIRWLRLYSDHYTFFVSGIPCINAYIPGGTAEQSGTSKSFHSVPNSDSTWLHIDGRQMEAENNNERNARDYGEYLAGSREYAFSFKMLVAGRDLKQCYHLNQEYPSPLH